MPTPFTQKGNDLLLKYWEVNHKASDLHAKSERS